MWINWLLRIQLGFIVLAVGAVFISNVFGMATLPVFLSAVLLIGLAAMLGVVSLLALLFSFIKKTTSWRRTAMIATGLGLIPLAVIILNVGGEGFSKPLIHDISTDMENPPQFVEALKLRRASDNSLEHLGDEIANLQTEAYPEVKPIYVSSNPAETFESALRVVSDLGWHLSIEDSSTGIIEAYEKTALFGFVDDVIIRIQPDNEGARVDVRSVSRVGQGDFGVNAERIMKFSAKLKGG